MRPPAVLVFAFALVAALALGAAFYKLKPFDDKKEAKVDVICDAGFVPAATRFIHFSPALQAGHDRVAGISFNLCYKEGIKPPAQFLKTADANVKDHAQRITFNDQASLLNDSIEYLQGYFNQFDEYQGKVKVILVCAN